MIRVLLFLAAWISRGLFTAVFSFGLFLRAGGHPQWAEKHENAEQHMPPNAFLLDIQYQTWTTAPVSCLWRALCPDIYLKFANQITRRGSSYTLLGCLKPDCEQEALFHFSSPECLHTIAVIVPFPYTVRFVLATQFLKNKQYTVEGYIHRW